MADIFFSYARADDVNYSERSLPWVRKTVDLILRRSRRDLGSVIIDKFFDVDDLYHSCPAQPQITDTLEKSCVFCAFISDAYFNREWCQEEVNFFTSITKKDCRNIVLLAISPYDRSFTEYSSLNPIPQHLNDLIKNCLGKLIPFYFFYNKNFMLGTPSAPGRLYSQKIDNVADEIVSCIRKCRKTPIPPPSPGRLTIYLSAVPNSLSTYRVAVKHHLESLGVNVMPADNLSASIEQGINLADRTTGYMKHANLHVQLLGADPHQNNYACIQAQVAQTMKMPMLLWRNILPREINNIQDADYEKLVRRAQSGSFEKFLQQLSSEIESLSGAQTSHSAGN